jgi:hypothetical protein
MSQELTHESVVKSMKRWEQEVYELDLKASKRLQRARRLSFGVFVGSLSLYAASGYMWFRYRKAMEAPDGWKPVVATVGVSLSALACVLLAVRISRRADKYYDHHSALRRMAYRNFWNGYGAGKVELDYSLMQHI